jgi:hypothetical protein
MPLPSSDWSCRRKKGRRELDEKLLRRKLNTLGSWSSHSVEAVARAAQNVSTSRADTYENSKPPAKWHFRILQNNPKELDAPATYNLTCPSHGVQQNRRAAMKSFTIPAATAAALLFASLSYGQTSTAVSPGGNPEYRSAGSPLNVPTAQEQITKTPGSSANAVFPTAGAPANAPTPQEQVAKTPGSRANAEFPTAGAPLRDKQD